MANVTTKNLASKHSEAKHVTIYTTAPLQQWQLRRYLPASPGITQTVQQRRQMHLITKLPMPRFTVLQNTVNRFQRLDRLCSVGNRPPKVLLCLSFTAITSLIFRVASRGSATAARR